MDKNKHIIYQTYISQLNDQITDTDECFQMSLRHNIEADFNNEQNDNFMIKYFSYLIRKFSPCSLLKSTPFFCRRDT